MYENLISPKYNTNLKVIKSHFDFDDGILSTFERAIDDLCSLHNVAIKPLNIKNEELRKDIEKYPYPTDIDSMENAMLLRINQQINATTDKVNSVNSFLTQVISVFCWTQTEQAENKLINLLNIKKNDEEHPGFVAWKKRKDFFKDFGVNINQFKNYTKILELQKVNNKIKHLGKVDSDLIPFKAFKGKMNYPFEYLKLPVVDYVNNSYLYLIELMTEIENNAI
ncbi:hypothetical protein [uncultured Tenacibaculum sp.]|uniref:hypothetical protein n=1 Tax=uncultured Tenacibaculum sp. TaxID=174713 RepID=UPI002628DCEF|nr:hypothetical protein [uncultured Tenacibaculum sp.]